MLTQVRINRVAVAPTDNVLVNCRDKADTLFIASRSFNLPRLCRWLQHQLSCPPYSSFGWKPGVQLMVCDGGNREGGRAPISVLTPEYPSPATQPIQHQ